MAVKRSGKQAPKFTAWSYSRLAAWEECPLKAKLKLIDKLEEPDSPALQRGKEAHTLAEMYATGKLDDLPEALVEFADEFDELRRKEPLVEQQWAFNSQWQPTGWFDRDAWLRVICDAVVIDGPEAIVIDHKTGKAKDQYQEQVELFALAVFSKYPDVQTVMTQLWYLDHGVLVEDEFGRDEYEKLVDKWTARTGPFFADDQFAPRPGQYCRWCHFSRAKTGKCEY